MASPGAGTSLDAWQGSASALHPSAVSSWHGTGTRAGAHPTWRALGHPHTTRAPLSSQGSPSCVAGGGSCLWAVALSRASAANPTPGRSARWGPTPQPHKAESQRHPWPPAGQRPRSGISRPQRRHQAPTRPATGLQSSSPSQLPGEPGVHGGAHGGGWGAPERGSEGRGGLCGGVRPRERCSAGLFPGLRKKGPARNSLRKA